MDLGQGMMGGTKAQYDCIKVFSETDQIVRFADSGPLSAKLLKNSTLKVYRDLPHGMPTTHADIINADLLEFFKA